MKRLQQTGFQKRKVSEKYKNSSSHSDISTTRHKADGMRTNKAIIEKENKTEVVMMSDRPFTTHNFNASTSAASDAPTDGRDHFTMTPPTRKDDNRENPTSSASDDGSDGVEIAVTSDKKAGDRALPTVRVLTTASPTASKEDNGENPISSARDHFADGQIAVTSGKTGAAAKEEQEREKKDDQQDGQQDDDEEEEEEDEDDNSILGSTTHANRDGKLKKNRTMAKERRTAKEKMNKLMKERIQELTLCNNVLRRKNDDMIRELASLGVDVLINPPMFHQPDFDGESDIIGPGQVPLSVFHMDQPGVEMIGGSNFADPAVFGSCNMVSTRDGLLRLSDNSHPVAQTFINRPPPVMWNQGGVNEIRQHPPLHEFGGSSSAASSGHHTRGPGYTGAASLNQRPIGFGPQPQRYFVMPFQMQDHFPRPNLHAYHSPAVLATSYRGEAARPNLYQEQMHVGRASPQNASTMRDAKRRAVNQVEKGHPNLVASTAPARMTGVKGGVPPPSRFLERGPMPQNQPNKRSQNAGSPLPMASPDPAVATFLKQLKQNDDRHRPSSTHVNESDPSLSPAGDASSVPTR